MSAVAFLAVRGVSLLSGAVPLLLSVLIETVGLNLALGCLKAHKDAIRLFRASWQLNTFGIRQAVRKA